MLGLLKRMATTLKHAMDDETFTVSYPEEQPEVSPRFRGVHKFSQERCLYCRLSEAVCPVDAILLTQNFEFVAETKDEFDDMEALRTVPWYNDIDPLEAREPDREAWVGEGEGEVDYQ